jgi:hypothetical protein
MSAAEFVQLLESLAGAWQRGDARAAAELFTEDAVYCEPPDRQLYVGREALYEFFGGDEDPPPVMQMTWHHAVFDERKQIGAGEYTFEGRNRYHGVALVRIVDGRIATWREYQRRSELDWTDFVGGSWF